MVRLATLHSARSKKDKHATVIQRHVRGRQGRTRAVGVRETKKKLRLDRAATVINKVTRGWRNRKEVRAARRWRKVFAARCRCVCVRACACACLFLFAQSTRRCPSLT